MPPEKKFDSQPIPAFMIYKNKVENKKIKKKRKPGLKATTKKFIKSQKINIVKEVKEENEKIPTLVSIKKKRIHSSIINPCKKEKIQEKLLPEDDPTIDAQKLFEWVINPISPSYFFKTYWEQKVLHIKRTNSAYYSHILNSSSLDKILRNNNLYYTKNIDVVTYENGVKEVFNQEGKATPSALWDYYSNGCSIRVLNPHTYNHKVHLLLSTLQEYFGCMVGANVYLTPPGSQGFAPHYDDIEAFVIQLEGRKHWKLYQPRYGRF